MYYARMLVEGLGSEARLELIKLLKMLEKAYILRRLEFGFFSHAHDLLLSLYITSYDRQSVHFISKRDVKANVQTGNITQALHCYIIHTICKNMYIVVCNMMHVKYRA